MGNNIFVRILIAALFVVFLFLLLPPFFAILDLAVAAELLQIIKIVIVAVALFYVFTGKPTII